MQNNANFRNFKLIMARHYSWLLITTPLVELTPSDIVAPCIRNEIRIPESGKFFLVERGILGFGIRNRVQGIKISIKTGIRNQVPLTKNPESRVPGIRKLRRGIHNPRLSWILLCVGPKISSMGRRGRWRWNSPDCSVIVDHRDGGRLLSYGRPSQMSVKST